MSKRVYSDFLQAYLQYAAHTEAPTAFHTWTALSAIAGALRRRVWIDMGLFEWTPNMYIIFVGPAGIVNKSSTAAIGMDLLRALDNVNFGPDAVTWQALITSLAEGREDLWLDPKDPMSEVTSFSAVTLASSEFGTFLNPQDRQMIDVLVDLWDGRTHSWEKATKHSGSDKIERPWINILACTTPDWIASNFPEYMVGGGFSSRCIFVYAEKKERLVAYPKLSLPSDYKERKAKLTHDLEIISNELVGEYDIPPTTIQWGTAWYEYHYSHRPAHLDNARFRAYLSRKQTHIHKVGMCIAASRHNEMVLKKEDLETAEALVTRAEEDMPKVFSLIGTTEGARIQHQLVELVRAMGSVERTVLYASHFPHIAWNEFNEAMNNALMSNEIKMMQTGSSFKLVAHQIVKPVTAPAPREAQASPEKPDP